MKKIFTLIASVIAVAASAQSFNENVVEDAISNEAPSVVNIAQSPRTMFTKVSGTVKGIRKAAIAPASLVGSYVTDEITTNLSSSGYSYRYSTQVSIAKAADSDTLIITGIAGSSATYPLKGVVTEDGKLSIPANQQVSKSASYGKVVLRSYVVQDNSLVLSEDPITFTIYPGAGLLLDQYALARAIPEYSTGNYTLTPYYYGTAAYVPNAKYTQKTAVSKTAAALAAPLSYSVNAYVYSANADSIRVIGFGRVSSAFMTVDAKGNVEVPNDQNLFYNSTNKYYYHPYPINVDYETPTVTFYSKKNVTGLAEGEEINLVPWGMYGQNPSTNGWGNSNGYNLSSTISLNKGVFFPVDTTSYKVNTKVKVVCGSKNANANIVDQTIAVYKKNGYNAVLPAVDKIKLSIGSFTSDVWMDKQTVNGLDLTDGKISIKAGATPVVYLNGKEIKATVTSVEGTVADGILNATITATFTVQGQEATMTVVYGGVSTGIATVKAATAAKVAKMIENGKVVIKRNGKTYNVAGQEM